MKVAVYMTGGQVSEVECDDIAEQRDDANILWLNLSNAGERVAGFLLDGISGWEILPAPEVEKVPTTGNALLDAMMEEAGRENGRGD